jgi:uncharacterized Zn finger protein
MIDGQVNIDVYGLENLKCDHCGGIYFADVHVIKIVPKLLVGVKEDQHQILNALRCVECGYVPNGDVFISKPKLRIE